MVEYATRLELNTDSIEVTVYNILFFVFSTSCALYASRVHPPPTTLKGLFSPTATHRHLMLKIGRNDKKYPNGFRRMLHV